MEDIAAELNQKEDHSKDIAENAVKNPQLIYIILNLISSDVTGVIQVHKCFKHYKWEKSRNFIS